MKRSTKSSAVLTMAASLVLSFTTLATAQNDATRNLYVSAANVPTNIAGVNTFATPPEGFNALVATDEELATYGLPLRPDKQLDAQHYASWERAMAAAKIRWNGELKPIPSSRRGVMQVNRSSSQQLEAQLTGPKNVSTFNWSGVALTNTLKKWNAKTSIYDIYSVFSVPTSQLPFGSPAQCTTPYWTELSWVGLDGYNPFLVDNGALQGGMESVIDCGVPTPVYYAYIGWGNLNTVFRVNGGDVMYVEVSNSLGGLNPGYVFVEDLSTLTYNAYSVPNDGIPLVGNSAQWVVERLCCGNTGYPYPLLNTISIFFDGGAALNLSGRVFYPGSNASSTVIMTMVDDGDTQNIEVVNRGSVGYEGEHGLWFQDVGCAFAGGCVGY
jgi:Peptidase A4 family